MNRVKTMAEIRSESKFIWKFIWQIIITPITLLFILFRKKEAKELFRPFIDLGKFIFEPKVTFFIIVINVIIFIASLFFSEALFNTLVNYPSDLFSKRWYTLFTAGFLHASLGHLLGNVLGIFLFGRVVEKALGPLKTALIYLGALLISSLFSSIIYLFIFQDNTGGLGASGALMGLVSAAILLSPFYITYELIIPLPIMIVGWIAIYADISGIISPAQDNIGHLAHLGGFLSIALLVFFLGAEDKGKLKKGLWINLGSLVLGVLLYFLI